ncbi:MAG: 23S rRNA (adenine(2030)-N(6))-methyltransferase RlmJ [Phyllobacteriaceae bacterium]|jgi:23S rRNA (adenine2030-N6)-methyltransferase|nr:23S rRNA (adenine(2030)-N(6))-methyltransferase RlmJ [Phyllobacteriaceae bacterium]
MNYRHAFHAGNFADIVKHVILTRALTYLQRKDKPVFVLDTHAGLGSYDLESESARKTAEADDGIGRLWPHLDGAPDAVAALLAPFADAVRSLNPTGEPRFYPGSPALIAHLMRPQDRAVFCELHAEDHNVLAARFARRKRIRVENVDGWQALKTLLPPPERRGLVILDPPFEARNEFDVMLDGLEAAARRFATGTYLAWYPIKHETAVAAFRTGVGQRFKDALLVETTVAAPADAAFHGSGMAIINPPYTLASELDTLLPWLIERLERTPGAGACRIEALR